MASRKVETVRAAYAFFGEQDAPRLFELLADDVEVTDPIGDTVVRGKDAVGELWQRSLRASHSILVGEIIEMGDVVLVTAHHDFYDDDGARLGHGLAETHRFTFRGERIAKLEVMTFGEIPDEVRRRLGA